MRTTIFIWLSLINLSILTPASGQKRNDSITPLMAGADIGIVPTIYGKVRGYVHNGTYTFKGIPYAKADRFKPPTRPTPWDGVRSSMSYGPVCPLMDPTTRINDEGEFPFHHDWGFTNEDCLRLNIWSQGITDGKKRPVMVWIHGGGYWAGSSQELPSYDGESISKKGDVVLVSVNHRLNILGFLDLSKYGDSYKFSANAGILDLVAALEWVKANIANFGGDPGNVTIFGQSGGGGKVTTLMSAPSAKGLFQKAIVQSGAGSTFLEPEISTRIAAAVLDELGLKPSQVDSLQTVPYAKLAAAGNKAVQMVRTKLAAEGKPFSGFGWSPVHDGTFLPYQPLDKQALDLSTDIPLLIGTTKNEFIPSMWGGIPGLRTASLEEAKAYLQKKYKDKSEAYLAAVKKAYPNDTRPTDLIDVDDRFRQGAVAQGNAKVANGKAPVYMYLFTWQSPVFDGDFKAMHCMELPFVFNNISRCEEMTGGGIDAHVLADKMSQAWINFARSGNPNHKGLPNWEKYTAENGATMFFDNQCTEKFHHDKDLLEITFSKTP
jgi:para-nitrobenzyl esterase